MSINPFFSIYPVHDLHLLSLLFDKCPTRKERDPQRSNLNEQAPGGVVYFFLHGKSAPETNFTRNRWDFPACLFESLKYSVNHSLHALSLNSNRPVIV